MNVNVNQNELYKAINIVQKAVSSRTTMPILSGIMLEAKDNTIILTATDLEIGIKSFVSCTVIEEGSIVVQSRLFGDFVRKLPSNTNINLHSTDKNNLEIKCLNSEFNILGNSTEEFPQNTFDNQGVSLKIKSELLKNLIKYTYFASAQDNIKPIFAGCLIEIKNNICSFVALDGFRMSIKKEKIEFEGEASIVVPSKTLIEILRILEEDNNEVELIFSQSHISFKIENTIIISNVLEGKFIDYKAIIKDKYVSVVKVKSQSFKNSIERASLLAREDKNNLIILDINKNNMQINSTSEYGNAEENIEIEKDGEDIKIGFNSKYIIDVLKVIESEYISISFIGKNNPCFIKEIDNESYTYMVLPVRIV